MTSTDLDAVHAAYRMFAAGDLDGFLDLVGPDMVSTQSDAVPWRGVYRGRDGLRELFTRIGTLAGATFEPGEVIEDGDRIVVIGTARITPVATGRPHEIRELHVWRVGGGVPRAMDVFLNTTAELLAELDGGGAAPPSGQRTA